MRIEATLLGLLAAVAAVFSSEDATPRAPSTSSTAVRVTPYTLEEIHPPDGLVLEVGDITRVGGTLMMTTRRGEIWAYTPGTSEWKRFAQGLQEPLGIIPGRPGEFFVLQRPELSRIVDEDGDGLADLYERFSGGWGFVGNYHEYAMAFTRDKDGNFYGGLGLGFVRKGSNVFSAAWLGTGDSEYRGWIFRVTKEGKFEPWAPGCREPVGAAFNDAGDLFITDTQGSFIAANWIMHVEKGDFIGQPEALVWDEKYKDLVARVRKMKTPTDDPELNKLFKRPAVIIPYREMGSSIGGMIHDRTGGKFGPFTGQMILGDVMKPILMRASLEKVHGVYQGALMRLYDGADLGGGSHKLVFTENGELYIGQTARGWGRGHGLKKLTWTGEVAFEILNMSITKTGFDLTFTKKVDAKLAGDPKQYIIDTWRQKYTNAYGSARLDRTKPVPTAVRVSADGMRVSIDLPGMKVETVVNLFCPKLKSADGEPIRFGRVYYTINMLR